MKLPLTLRAGTSAHSAYRVAFGLLAAAMVFVAPFVVEAFRTRQLTQGIAFAVAVLGLNLLTGTTGQISLGHSAFIGVGAYTTAILVQQQSWTYLATIPVTFALCFALGYAIGIPALRIKGFHLALLTLGLAVVFPALVKTFDGLTGGTNGLRVSFDLVPPPWTGLPVGDEHIWTYFNVLAVAVVMFVAARNLTASRVGRAWRAIRQHETGAAVSGVNVAASKTSAFGYSAAFAGVAGSLLVMDTQFVSPDTFAVLLSIQLLTALFVGGIGTLSGSVVGGMFMVFVPWYTAQWAGPDATIIRPGVLYGLLLIGVMFVAPGGVMWLVRKARSRVIVVVPPVRPASEHRSDPSEQMTQQS
jgi:branched-chain amino acid transport system permease protein